MAEKESRYTPANDFCAHPEYWHSPDSEATENEVSEFIGALVGLIQPEFVLETGTYHGHTTAEIGLNLMENGHGYAVSIENDALEQNVAYDYINSIDPAIFQYISLMFINSMDYVPHTDIDFAFFDSWQEGRHLEFLRYHGMGRIKPGAIVAFHDTAPHHQVKKFIEGLERDGYIKALWFHTPRGLVVAQVLK